MLLPLLLIGLATGAAAIMAYGTHPGLAQYAHGLEMIMLTRRLEWPLISVSLIFCVALLGLVISNKRRAWWLIGLAPVLALFVHRFAPPANQRRYVVEFPEATGSVVPSDDSWVVGIVFEDRAYAMPYSALYRMPVVFITDYDKRLIVMWTAHANRALAYRIARDFKSRDLEIVTNPKDTLLIYDRRLGQFINSVTGLTMKGEKPVGLVSAVPTAKTTWGTWHKSHPATKLMLGFEGSTTPAAPILPVMAGAVIDGIPAEKRIAMLPTTQPAALDAETIGTAPVNRTIGQTSLLLFRDPAGRLHVFDRNVAEQLFPTFRPVKNTKFPDAVLIDSDSNSLWTIEGKAIDGQLKGTEMKRIAIEDDLYWGVMKYWYPQLTIAK